MRRWLSRATIALMRLVLRPLGLLPIPPQLRATVRAVLFITQVLPLPFKPQEWLLPSPKREPVTFQLDGEEGSADIFRIADGRVRAGVLVYPGANPGLKTDPRVANLGNALARAGFVVMVPWSPFLLQNELSPSDPDYLVRAFQYFRGLKWVDKDRVGMGGFCVAASMVLVAASDSRISGQVDFVSSFGAYYDLKDLIRQISTKRRFYRDASKPWYPSDNTQRFLANQLIGGLEEPEKDVMTGAFLGEDDGEQPQPDGFSMAGKTVHGLLSSMAATEADGRISLEEAESLFQRLPTSLLDDMDKVSPAASIGGLRARLLIAHDREDDAVPSEESRRLADALQKHGDLHYTEFSFISHVTPGRPVGPLTFIREAFKLFRYTYKVIRVST